MQAKFFQIPAADPTEAEEALNQFLRSKRVLTMEKQLVQGQGTPAYWSVVVEYMATGASFSTAKSTSGKEDYKEILEPSDFALFCRLKDVRKSLAEEAGVPVYSIFTNRHLADMARQRCRDVNEISSIHGVGKKTGRETFGPFSHCLSF